MGRRSAATDSDEVPQDDGRPIWEAAVAARQAGRTVFTCSATVAETSGTGLGLRGRSSGLKQWSVGSLIEAIEAQGWRLEHLDHVWVQTEHNQSLGSAPVHIRGLVRANMLFRRTPTPDERV